EASMLRHRGVENPLLADTDTIAAARQLVSENPELTARLRSGIPEKPTAPAAPAAPQLTPQQTELVRKARQASQFTPEQQALAKQILENVEPAAPKPTQTLDKIAREQYGKPYTELNDQQQDPAYDRWQSSPKTTPTPPGGTVAQPAPAVTAPTTTAPPEVPAAVPLAQQPQVPPG